MVIRVRVRGGGAAQTSRTCFKGGQWGREAAQFPAAGRGRRAAVVTRASRWRQRWGPRVSGSERESARRGWPAGLLRLWALARFFFSFFFCPESFPFLFLFHFLNS